MSLPRASRPASPQGRPRGQTGRPHRSRLRWTVRRQWIALGPQVLGHAVAHHSQRPHESDACIGGLLLNVVGGAARRWPAAQRRRGAVRAGPDDASNAMWQGRSAVLDAVMAGPRHARCLTRLLDHADSTRCALLLADCRRCFRCAARPNGPLLAQEIMRAIDALDDAQRSAFISTGWRATSSPDPQRVLDCARAYARHRVPNS